MQQGAEADRLAVKDNYRNWKKWGPYLAERQWGTVREDYSEYGNSWDYIDHEKARSKAYRWGEEGIGGFCDSREILCLAPAFWNGKDPILKERLFGLTNNQGNHGEDVKELYFHQISSPTHSYCKYLYKYPQGEFPYTSLVNENRIGRDQFEFEILETDAFKDNAYFDCFIEYAKADVDDILMKVTIVNRGQEDADIHVLPHLWFRNFWKHNKVYTRPNIKAVSETTVKSESTRNGSYYFYHEAGKQLFCENETNNKRIYNSSNDKDYVKVYSYNSNIDFSQIVKLRPDIKEYKFIVDANVGKVAKNLRMFGFDTHYDFDLPDKEIVNLAEREERIILSRDWGLLKRKNAIFGYYPRKTNTDEQLAEIIKRYNLYDKFKPLSLCLECNGQIVKVEKSEAKEHLDEGVLKDYNDFYKCKTCQKYFWKGSHYDKMLETIDKWKKHV